MIRACIVLLLCSGTVFADEELRAAVNRSLPLLEKTMMVTSEKRTCFTCHNQGMPVMALVRARKRGFEIDETKMKSVLEHIAKSLERGRTNYIEGRGQGGKVDMAGYALWALTDGDWKPDENTAAVCAFILGWQGGKGRWKRHSNRPPTEASHFTTNYLGLLSLDAYATEAQKERSAVRMKASGEWLLQSEPKDTEDRVFHLRSLYFVEGSDAVLRDAAKALLARQREDGGWSQLESMESDAYATGSVLSSLVEAGQLKPGDPAFARGARFLLDTQREDGSWYVKSRSKPFQKYFESGFPHGKDQFISCAASCWATMALLEAIPEE